MVSRLFSSQNGDAAQALVGRLCIRIPEAGGRLIEAGDEKLLELDFGDGLFFVCSRLSAVPIILTAQWICSPCDRCVHAI
jgi:hypothetical protein